MFDVASIAKKTSSLQSIRKVDTVIMECYFVQHIEVRVECDKYQKIFPSKCKAYIYKNIGEPINQLKWTVQKPWVCKLIRFICL